MPANRYEYPGTNHGSFPRPGEKKVKKCGGCGETGHTPQECHKREVRVRSCMHTTALIVAGYTYRNGFARSVGKVAMRSGSARSRKKNLARSATCATGLVTRATSAPILRYVFDCALFTCMLTSFSFAPYFAEVAMQNMQANWTSVCGMPESAHVQRPDLSRVR